MCGNLKYCLWEKWGVLQFESKTLICWIKSFPLPVLSFFSWSEICPDTWSTLDLNHAGHIVYGWVTSQGRTTLFFTVGGHGMLQNIKGHDTMHRWRTCLLLCEWHTAMLILVLGSCVFNIFCRIMYVFVCMYGIQSKCLHPWGICSRLTSEVKTP